MISARLLGTPSVQVDGAAAPTELLWRKNLALCLSLWFAPERRRSRDQLIGLLWADKTESAARHSLNEALRTIRRVAGDEALDSSATSVAWVGALELDTDTFESLERRDADAAASLITGPFCDGFAVAGAPDFDAWLSQERDRWRHHLIAVLARAGRLAEDRGDAAGALRHAERALAIDANDEVALRGVVRALWLCGDRAGALQAGERAVGRLKDELGLESPTAMLALLADISRTRNALPPAEAKLPPPVRRAPLVARRDQLERLLAAWRDAIKASQPAVLVVAGRSGSGRSRMIEEMLARATIDGAATVAMRATAGDSTDPDAAWLALGAAGLDKLRGIAAAAPAAVATLVARLPAWAERFPVAGGAMMPLRDALGEVVRAAASERPLLIAIDDVVCLHPDAVSGLVVMLRNLAAMPIALLVTLDPATAGNAANDLISRAGRDIPGAVITLDALVRADIDALVATAVPDWTPTDRDRLGRRLYSESAGMPLIATAVLDAVLRGLSLDTGAWPAAGHTTDASLPAEEPAGLVAATRLAFRQLDPGARQLLQVASLLPEPAPAERLGSVAMIANIARRDELLDLLEADGWLAADARGYSFPAGAIRRIVAREMMTPGQRRRIEERIAAG